MLFWDSVDVDLGQHNFRNIPRCPQSRDRRGEATPLSTAFPRVFHTPGPIA